MEYLHFDPSGLDFPKPWVPVLPSLTWGSLGSGQPTDFQPIQPLQTATAFVRGRYALHEAFRQAGVGGGDVVLVPAYHCRTMLDPAISLGADVVLYRQNPDLSVDLQNVAEFLDKHAQRVKALLATHYFGFAQALDQLAQLCAQHGVALVEDCAHTLFAGPPGTGNNACARVGHSGTYCIASPAKFFPCEDGGLLWRNGPSLRAPQKPEAQRFLDQVKGWVHTFQHTLEKGPAPASQLSLPALGSASAGEGILANEAHDKLEISDKPSPAYRRSLEGVENLACSRWVMRHTDISRLTNQRRGNYRQWAAAVVGLPHCHALRSELPEDCVPYMFPLVLHRPASHFNVLKRLGLPIWRWDDMAVSDCKVASSYRLSLLHLPCHQELSSQQMAWMTKTVAIVLQQGAAIQ